MEELARARRADGDREHPLYRQYPEAWLESQVRAGIETIDSSLLPVPIYGQVPAFAAGERGIIDLLAVDRAGRLAVIELKNPGDENATLDGAFNQLQTYKSQITSLFRTNAALVISDGIAARIGQETEGVAGVRLDGEVVVVDRVLHPDPRHVVEAEADMVDESGDAPAGGLRGFGMADPAQHLLGAVGGGGSVVRQAHHEGRRFPARRARCAGRR